MRTLMQLVLAALVVFTFACAKKETAPKAEAKPETKNYLPPVPQTEAATVSGRIVFAGDAPKPQPIQTSADCAIHGGQARSEELVVGSGGGLANAFVYVKNFEGAMAPPKPLVLDQQGCQYKPRVIGVQVGQFIYIKNSDATFHNVHAVAKANENFNFGQPQQGQVNAKSFTAPEVMVKLKCDVHPWMRSYIGVLEHPFFAVSGADGSFAIEGLPAGEWEVEAWHETLGTRTARVTVGKGEKKEVSLTFGG